MNNAGDFRKTNPNKANLKTEDRSLSAISVAGQRTNDSPVRDGLRQRRRTNPHFSQPQLKKAPFVGITSL